MTVVDEPAQSRIAAPITSTERLTIIDVLRGFALGGVFFSNVHMWFSGRQFMPQAQQQAALATPANLILDWIERYLSGGKFVTIFSFLFGLGLAVQFERAEKRGQSATHFYLRRGSSMLLLAVVHLSLLWFGDILHLYALAGFVVLLFAHRKPQIILAWGIGFTLFSATSIRWLVALRNSMFASPIELATRAAERTALLEQTNVWVLKAFGHGSPAEIIHANAVGYWVRFVDFWAIGFFFELVGRILLGYYAGRIGLFNDIPAKRRTFQVLLVGGLVASVCAELGNQSITAHTFKGAPDTLGLLLSGLQRTLIHVHATGLAAFYIAALSLLFTRTWWRDKLIGLAPMGRMAVTNYLSQTVLAILIFYGVGWGMMGKLDPLTTFWLPIGVICLQIAWSHWWLRRFRFGPVEWFWRTLTYGTKQPMRR